MMANRTISWEYSESQTSFFIPLDGVNVQMEHSIEMLLSSEIVINLMVYIALLQNVYYWFHR